MRRPRDSKDLKEQSIVAQLRAGEKYIEEVNMRGDVMVALIYPNTYELAVSSLGFNLAWKYLNQLKQVRCERFVYDESFERFYSLDSRTPIDQFKVWAFSLHFENDLLNVVKLLLKKAVPLKNLDRTDLHPVVLFGGALTYVDLPLILKIADVILHGDIEPMLPHLEEAFQNIDRSSFLNVFVKFPFASVPALGKGYEGISQCRELDLYVPASPVVPSRGDFAGRLLIEIERGCIHRCAYCMMGKLKKPARFLSLEKISDVLHRHNSVGLIASNVTDYPWLDELIDLLERSNVSVSVSSLRLDRLSERFLNFLKRHQNSFTVALESASERLRNVLKKDLSDVQIEKALLMARKAGFEEIKVYFMFGFDEETEHDLRAIGDVARHLLELGFRAVKFSINPFVPKRGTEMGERHMQDEKTLKEKMKMISSSLPKEVKTTFESLKQSKIQYIINSMDEDSAENFLMHAQHSGEGKIDKLVFEVATF